MSNVYEAIENLADEIKKSKEYLDYKQMKEVINENPVLENKIKKFEKERYDAQISTIKGEKPDDELIESMQKAYIELMQNETTKKYLEAEIAFNTMFTDINKVLADTLKNVMD